MKISKSYHILIKANLYVIDSLQPYDINFGSLTLGSSITAVSRNPSLIVKRKNVRYVNTQTVDPQSEEVRTESEVHNSIIRITADELKIIEQEIKSNNENIKDVHDNLRENLDSSTKSQLVDADNKHDETMDNFRKDLHKDNESIFSGKETGEIKRDMAESEISHSKYIKEVLDNSNILLPEGLHEYYENLLQKQMELNERNNQLNEEQMNNHSAYYEFTSRAYGNLIHSKGPVGNFEDSSSEVSSNNECNSGHTERQGSLIDDFADTSTEQPSHMDPED